MTTELKKADGFNETTVSKQLSKRGIYGFADLQELASSQPPDLVEELFSEQSVNILVGDSGLGKTPLAVTLAVAVASGTPFLGKKTQPGRVLYCDAETPVSEFYRMMLRISKAAGLSAPPADALVWSPNWQSAAGESHELIEQVRVATPRLVIIDPLRMFYPDAEAKAKDAEPMFKELRKCCKDLECSFLILHHRRKPSAQGTPSLKDEPFVWLQETAGSYALINHTDSRLGVDPAAKADLVLCGFVRSHGPVPPIHLSRIRDDEGDPLGYEPLVGLSLLNENYQQAFMALEATFTWSDAKSALGNTSDSNTSSFLKQCMSLKIVAKQGKNYTKAME